MSIQLPEQQQRHSSSLFGPGRWPPWPLSSLHAPSLSDVSFAHSCCDRVRRRCSSSRIKANLIFSPEASFVGSIASCPSFVRIGRFTGRSFSSCEGLPSGVGCDMSGKCHAGNLSRSQSTVVAEGKRAGYAAVELNHVTRKLGSRAMIYPNMIL